MNKASAPLLRVKNLKKYFPIRAGLFGKVRDYVKAVDGVSFDLAPGETLLDAARRAGIGERIPTLCHLAGSAPEGGCRLCLVEVEGRERPVAACHSAAAGRVTPAKDSHLVRVKGLLRLADVDCRSRASGNPRL